MIERRRRWRRHPADGEGPVRRTRRRNQGRGPVNGRAGPPARRPERLRHPSAYRDAESLGRDQCAPRPVANRADSPMPRPLCPICGERDSIEAHMNVVIATPGKQPPPPEHSWRVDQEGKADPAHHALGHHRDQRATAPPLTWTSGRSRRCAHTTRRKWVITPGVTTHHRGSWKAQDMIGSTCAYRKERRTKPRPAEYPRTGSYHIHHQNVATAPSNLGNRAEYLRARGQSTFTY